jgi:hypothetical protein
VVKDFVDEATGVLRPFRGKVTAVSRRTQWYADAVALPC